MRYLLLTWVALMMAFPALAETRLALVIDQTNYAHTAELSRVTLANTEGDLIHAALVDTGFKVTRVSDRTKQQLIDALDDFRILLEQAGPEAVGFVYYTGHGAQHPQSRSSYLLGTDARMRSASDLAAYGIDLEAQRDGFAATGAKAVFLVFDACRNVATGSGYKANVKGISRVEAEADMLIAYSTGLDDVAEEGVYAPVLAEEIRRPGQTAETLFASVQQRVASATERKQRPWYNPQLYNKVCFNGCDMPVVRDVAAAAPPKATVPAVSKYKAGDVFRDVLSSGGQGPEMVVVRAGSFTMGSPSSEIGRLEKEGPQRTVTIGSDFAVGRYEVTWAEWDACVADDGCSSAGPDVAGGDESWGKGKRPVINVSWDDANAYADWLSRKSGQSYRLLSEAEWEYAARAGTTTPFSFGSTISTSQANYDGNYTYGSGASGEYRQKTTQGGGFSGNAFGLYDMHGNVREWTQDCYNESYSGAPKDGSAWTSGDCARRVVRGGSWYGGPQDLRSANRIRIRTSDRGDILGFRVARTLP